MTDDLLCKLHLRDVEAEFVNPFLVAFQETLISLGNKPSSKGDLKLVETDLVQYDVSALLRISGGVQGAVIFGMSEPVACKFASCCLMGIMVDTMDQMARSSLDEFSLRISKKARDQLVNKGYFCNVSHSVSYGRSIRFNQKTQFLHVTYIMEHGALEVLVNLSRA
jgi:chemotaxis protein CheX